MSDDLSTAHRQLLLAFAGVVAIYALSSFSPRVAGLILAALVILALLRTGAFLSSLKRS